MIATILALLSSGGFGSLLGLVGGYFNRKLDITSKEQEYRFELDKLDKNLEFMKAEYEQKTKVATIEGESAKEVAGYNAMAASYSYAPITGDSGIDKFSKIVRPLLTLAFFLFTIILFIQIALMVDAMPLDKDAVSKAYLTIIEWVLFQAGVSIGWWFAMRPGKSLVGVK